MRSRPVAETDSYLKKTDKKSPTMPAKGSRTPDLKDLKAELDLLRDEFPTLPDDDLFVLWFMFAFVAGSKEEAAGSLTGHTGEKGVDALHIDHQAKLVTLVQGK